MSYNSKYKGAEVEGLLDSIGNKVDKVDGKQLSTEDFTTLLKNKLDGLSNYDDTEIQTAVSKLRTDLDTLVSGDTTTAIKTFNEVIAFLDGLEDTEDLASIIGSIEQQIASKAGKSEIPTKVSQLDNDSDFVKKKDVDVPDEEDITSVDNKLKFKDRTSDDGMGYVIIRKGKTLTEQITQINTIYEIHHDFDLNGENVTIPNNSTLKFVGGKLFNGGLIFNKTKLEGEVNVRCSVAGSLMNDFCHINWFASDGDKVSDIFQFLFNTVKHIYVDSGTWYIEHLVQMKSGVTVEGVDKNNSVIKADAYGLNTLREEYDMFSTLDHWIYRWDYADKDVSKEDIDRQMATVLLTDVTFKNLSFDGNKISLGDADLIKAMHKSCICFVNSLRCSVINCCFKEEFTLSHNEGSHAIQYIYSQDCVVDGCQANSVSLVCMDYSENVSVTNCKVNTGTDAIIETRGGRGHIIEHNIFTDKLWPSSFVGINSPYCTIRHNRFVCTSRTTTESPLSMLTIGHEGINEDASYTIACENTLVSDKQSRGIMVLSGVGIVINNNVINTKAVSADIYDSWAGIQLYGSEKTHDYIINNNTINAPTGIGISSSSVGGKNIITNNKITSRYGILANTGSYHIKDNSIDVAFVYTSIGQVNLEMVGNTINGRTESPYTDNGAMVISNSGILRMKDNVFNNLPYIQLIPQSNCIVNIKENIIANELKSNFFFLINGSNLQDSDADRFVIKDNMISGYECIVNMSSLQSNLLNSIFVNNADIKSAKVLQSTEESIWSISEVDERTLALASDTGCFGVRSGTRWLSTDGYTLARKRGTSTQFPNRLTSQDVGFIYFNTSDGQHYKAKSINSDGTAEWEKLNVMQSQKIGIRADNPTNQTSLQYNIVRVSANYTGAVGIYRINKNTKEVIFVANEDNYGDATKAMYITYNPSGIVVNANEAAVNGGWVLNIEELL